MPSVSVTFAPNSPQQITCNPDPVHVPYGNNQTVTWNLNGPPGAAFTNQGVAFKNSSPGTLSQVSATQYQLTDDNTNTGTDDIDYPYTINILYNGTPYSWDPEVANDPRGGGGLLRYKAK